MSGPQAEVWLPVIWVRRTVFGKQHGRIMRTAPGANNTYVGKILKPHSNSKGYLSVGLAKHGKRYPAQGESSRR